MGIDGENTERDLRIAALMETLDFYAAPETWWLRGEVVGDDNGIPLTAASRPIDSDNGARARAALAGAWMRARRAGDG